MYTGGCLCGAVRFTVERTHLGAVNCYCGMCRRALGNLFGTWVILKRKDLRFLTREPDWFQSSDRVRRGFCKTCGSPVVYRSVDKDFDAVWIGTLDEVTAYKPRAHYHTENKIPWVDIHSDLPVKS